MMNYMPAFRNVFALLSCLAMLSSCRTGDVPVPSTGTVVGTGSDAGDIKGFFLLNEGNMGSNKASLDYYDYSTGIYHRNIFPERNPDVVHELGDVGNDLQIYGSKLYAVINCSNLIEVMDVATARHITSISIPNCRYIVFDKGYAYVSSYAGPVQIDPNARPGFIARIDTMSMSVVDRCVVGYQPEEMCIIDNKLYVANSGGYRVPDYDNRVSVIDLDSFTVIKEIEVAQNLHRLEPDGYGCIYVSRRGNYYDEESKTYIVDARTDQVADTLHLLPNSNMTRCGDSLYVYSNQWNWDTERYSVDYAIFDVRTRKVVTRNFITDGTESEIKVPYGIAVNPENGDILVTDAKDYVTPGMLHCYDRFGKRKWSVMTGDIPAHIVFTRKKLQSL